MPSHQAQLLKGLLGSLAFVAAGVFMRWADAPAPLVWSAMVFGALGLTAVIYRFFKPIADAGTNSAGDSTRVVLRDGRDYRVDVTDAEFSLTHKTSSEVRTMGWSEVTFVVILAIDNFPIGGISFLVHRSAGNAIEVPWDAEGNGAFLNAMQEKLPGFDNGAVIEASSMLHGFKQVWPPESKPDVTPPG